MKKLKYQYKQSMQSTRHDYPLIIYPNVRSSIFKKFSTHQERSFYFLHRIEYKSYSLKIRVARGTGANSNMRCDRFKSTMIINQLRKSLQWCLPI